MTQPDSPTRSRFLRGCASAAGLALVGAHRAWASSLNSTTLTVAVVPQFSALDIEKAWGPVLDKLQTDTGIALQLLTYTSIPRFEKDFLEGRPDLVFMNPYHAVLAWHAHRYEPLVRDGEKPLTGILVTAQGGAVRSVGDLQGKRLAFPAPNAFGASLYIRAMLAEVHRLRFEASYVNTHTNAYRHVLMGDAAGAGGIRATLARESESVRQALTVLLETPPAAAHPLAAHPRIDATRRQAIGQALLRLAQSESGLGLLKPTTLARPVLADYGRDYAPLEKLNLSRYAVLEKD